MARLENTRLRLENPAAPFSLERHPLAIRYNDEQHDGDVPLNNLKTQSQEIFGALRLLMTRVKDHPHLGRFTGNLTTLHDDHQALAEMLRNPQTLGEIEIDPAAKTLVMDDLRNTQKQIDEVQNTIGKELPGDAGEQPVPGYVEDNRPPLDRETFLGNSELAGKLGLILEKTELKVKGAAVYRDQDGNYYHRDILHRGSGSEIEWYAPDRKHAGTLYPDGSEKGGPVKGRRLPKV